MYGTTYVRKYHTEKLFQMPLSFCLGVIKFENGTQFLCVFILRDIQLHKECFQFSQESIANIKQYQ